MTLVEKAAYIKGLMDGMHLDTDKDSNKLLSSVVDLLQDAARSIARLEDNAIAISDELEEVEDNLDLINNVLFDEEDDDEDFDLGDDYDYGEDDALYEITCPKCGTVQQVDEDTLLSGSTECPNCKEPLEFEFDEEDE